jgi:hypothetical protein
MNHKINDPLSLFVCLEVRVNLMCLCVISHSLIVALKILVDGSSVVVKIRIRLFLKSFGLRVGLQSQSKLSNAIIVYKEVGQVSVSEDVPRL